jgi:hypothetical protein
MSVSLQGFQWMSPLYLVPCPFVYVLLHFLYMLSSDCKSFMIFLGLAPVLKEHILRKPSSSKFLTLQGTAHQKLRSLQGLDKADLAANMLV